jgi:hypothetical protein
MQHVSVDRTQMSKDVFQCRSLVKHWGYALHKKLRGFSPQANYTEQATAACRRS